MTLSHRLSQQLKRRCSSSSFSLAMRTRKRFLGKMWSLAAEICRRFYLVRNRILVVEARINTMSEPNTYPIPLNCAPPTPAKFNLPVQNTKDEKLPRSHSGYHYMIKDHTVDIDHNSWITTVRQSLNQVRPNSEPSKPCTIFKFPKTLKNNVDDQSKYTPLVVSIGPYHNFSNPRGTMKAMQDHKWRCVRHLLSRHKNHDRASQILDECLVALKALDSEVRSCYSENLYHVDSKRLASIMLMDGCFIIYLLLKQVENDEVEEVEDEVVVVIEDGKGKAKLETDAGRVELEIGKGEEDIDDPLLGMSWIWNLVVFDLLKLENQMPFFVIQTILDYIKTPRDKNLDLASLALKLFHDIHPNKSKAFTTLPANQIHHLLHLFHSSLIPRKYKSSAKTTSEWISSATNLIRFGIKFVKKENAECCLDVTFNDGRIEIPPLQVYDYSKSLFKNIIVFEQCFPDVGKYFTNYANFMECIIRSVEDVKLLSSKGIVLNRFGTNEVAMDFFKRHNIQYASEGNYLAEVLINAKKYQDSKWRKWRAQLMSKYLSNLQASFAFVVVVLLLVLVAEHSFFAACSFFCPP
ncbi:UPF0481 protein At3g47200-like [Asparagus officinalis]|uniref:UPF0481 protein At3g47200-like n=1 Tax=Asparagus officinalis TaxID=4686 RepID=UPI00098E7FE9|nr:UPF0481 protein At3g47200-like [Asparagus officinalis]